MIETVKINVLGSHHVTNCYIVYDKNTKDALIIDPADNAKKIMDKIEELSINPKYIALTHAHKDHTMALEELQKNYNVKVIASVLEKDMIEGRVSDCASAFGLEQQPFDTKDFIFLKDGESFKVGDLQIELFFTPGHTRGSACYWLKDENAMFTGDTLFLDSFGRTDLDSGDIYDMAASLLRLYDKFKGVYIYPGHGENNIKIEDTYEAVKDLIEQTAGINLDEMRGVK